MNFNFKHHILQMDRYQTSEGRDLERGLRLDRNEKVSTFSQEVLNDIFSSFQGFSLSASPDAASLYEKISGNLNIDKDHIFVTAGITEGIRILYDLYTQEGDNVICLDPTYPMYWIYAEMYKVEYRKFTYNKTSLKPNDKSLYDQIDDKTKIVFIPNPNLPIESCFSVNEINKIAAICMKKNILLVIDEAYYYFGAPTVLDLVKDFKNLIVFRTFSKAYGLAAIRLGFMVGDPELINYFSKSRSIVESNTLSMQVAEYFIDHQELREGHVQEVKQGAQYIHQELEKLGLRYYGGELTNGLVIFLESGEDSNKIVLFMEQQNIYIRGSFESPFENVIRISLGSLEAMEKFIYYLKVYMEDK